MIGIIVAATWIGVEWFASVRVLACDGCTIAEAKLARFVHPAPDVLARYHAASVGILRTDLDGAVRIRLTGEDVRVEGERERAPRYWRRRPPV